MILLTNAGDKVQTQAYAWAAVAPRAHWIRRASDPAAPKGSLRPDDEVTGPQGRLARLQPFEDGAMRAVWSGQTYVVLSYRTPIVKVHAEPDKRGQVEVNDTAYSVATSHHQQVATTWAGYAVAWVERRG